MGPMSHIIPERLIQTTAHPIGSGGFGDVWEGVYNDKRVVIKVLCAYEDENVQKVRKVIHPVFLIP